ncbi:MAG: CsgG/HfaB family protein [Phycisphaerae bacterium]
MRRGLAGVSALAGLWMVLAGPGRVAARQVAVSNQQDSSSTRVAVLDFRVIGSGLDPSAGEALALVVRSAVVKGGGVRLIERAELKKILTEQDLQLTDMVDPATAVEVGRLAGVDRLVLGSIAAIEGTYTVTCRVIDVTTGEAADAEEFTLNSFEPYPRLGRLLGALIGEQPVTEESVARAPSWTETFQGPASKLPLSGPNLHQGSAKLDAGRYLLSRYGLGNQYAWLPTSGGPFYVQVDLAQLQGPRRSGCGLVWGARGTDDYLSVWLDGEQGLRLERRQGGTTSSAFLRKRVWPVLHERPRSNRVRLESWEDRHRVFVNGVLVDDFFEPGYDRGKVGLRVFTREDGVEAVCAADNLVYGPIDLASAGFAVGGGDPWGPGAKKTHGQNRKRPGRTEGPWAVLSGTRITRESRNGVDGLVVHVGFEVGNLKGQPLRLATRFFDPKTFDRLKDKDGQYTNARGFVVAVRDFTPRYRVSTYTDLTVFIPVDQLHLPRSRKRVRYQVMISNPFEDIPVQLARSKQKEISLAR